MTSNRTTTAAGFPLPGTTPATVVAAPQEQGPQHWAGASSAVVDDDGSIVVAYRVREGGRDHNVIARSPDGVQVEPVARVTPDQLGASMVERPCLVRLTDRWRLYVSAATPGSAHWWVGLLEADTVEGLAAAAVVEVMGGDATVGVKDPVVRPWGDGWQAWVCWHHLEVPGQEDRMSTAWATSDDGVRWEWRGVVLGGRPGAWDARGARVTSVLPDGRVSYDGRADAAENWFERTGVAGRAGEGLRLEALAGSPVVDVRYLDVLALPQGGHRLYYEARLADETHELHTELLPASR
jgi:hypothetical protein